MKFRFPFFALLAATIAFTANAVEAGDGFATYTAGDMKIVRVTDLTGSLPASALRGNEEEINELLPGGSCPNDIVAYVFDTGNELVLLDTGFGDSGNGKMVENLRKAGYAPEAFTKILFTHLHGDHVGGTIKDHQAVFPNAEMYVPEAELAFWLDRKNNLDKAPAILGGTFDLVAEFARLYAGKIKTFKEGERCVDWLKPIAVPGHTDGHTMFELSYGNEKRFIWGDIMHCLKVQAKNPDISIVFDTDQAMAAQSRTKALELVSDTGIPVFGIHFPAPGAALFYKAADGGYAYTPVEPR